MRVSEDNNLTTLGYVAFTLQVGPRDREAIDDQAVTSIESRFHAGTRNAKTAKEELVDQCRAQDDGNNKTDDPKDIFDAWMGVKK